MRAVIRETGGTIVTKFWELLEESVIVQACITLILVGVVGYLAATGQEIPDIMGHLASLILGYYFGVKGNLTATKAAQQAVAQLEQKEGEQDEL